MPALRLSLAFGVPPPGAAERPVLVAGAQAGLHRVRLDVLDLGQEVSLIPDVAVVVLVLPKASLAFEDAVGLLCSKRLPRMEDRGEAVISDRRDQAVDVVRQAMAAK